MKTKKGDKKKQPSGETKNSQLVTDARTAGIKPLMWLLCLLGNSIEVYVRVFR